MFDNVLELLVMAGRSLPHAILMMIPEPWQSHREHESGESGRSTSTTRRSWSPGTDRPRSRSRTATVIGAVLDRNGLRPSRYYVTTDDLVIHGVGSRRPRYCRRSECCSRNGFSPGRIFLVDTERPAASSRTMRSRSGSRASSRIGDWLAANLVSLDTLPAAPELPTPDRDDPAAPAGGLRLHPGRSPGCSSVPWRRTGEEPVGSMGNDTPLAVLSERPQTALRLLQAVVRAGDQSPAGRDPRRAGHVDGLDDRARTQPAQARTGIVPANRHHLPGARQRRARQGPARREQGLSQRRRSRCCSSPRKAAPGWSGHSRSSRPARWTRWSHGHTILILSDRRGERGAVRRSRACWPRPASTITWCAPVPVPGARLVVESGDAREVHHMALLIGYGAGAVNPYLAFETIERLDRRRRARGADAHARGRPLHHARSTRAS